MVVMNLIRQFHEVTRTGNTKNMVHIVSQNKGAVDSQHLRGYGVSPTHHEGNAFFVPSSTYG